MKKLSIFVLICSLFLLFISCNKEEKEHEVEIINIEQIISNDEKGLDIRDNDIKEQEVEEKTQDSHEDSCEKTMTQLPAEDLTPIEETTPIEEEPLTVYQLKTAEGEFKYNDICQKNGEPCAVSVMLSSGLYGLPIAIVENEYTIDAYTTKGVFIVSYYDPSLDVKELDNLTTEGNGIRLNWYHEISSIYYPWDIGDVDEYLAYYDNTYIFIAFKQDDIYRGYLILEVVQYYYDDIYGPFGGYYTGPFMQAEAALVANKVFDMDEKDLCRITKELFEQKINIEIANYIAKKSLD